MSEKEQTHLVGDDGKLYFTFPLGAVYELRPPYDKPFTYTILSCDYEKETEYYRVESDGKELPVKFSASQLEFMLGWLPGEQTEAGELVELPLLIEEVQAFYNAKRKELNKANVEANAKINGTAYKKNLQAIKSVKESLRLARINDEAKVSEWESKLAKLEEEQSKILESTGVDLKILTKAVECNVCFDTGIIEGKICECAMAQQDKIKSFNAEERKAKRA